MCLKQFKINILQYYITKMENQLCKEIKKNKVVKIKCVLCGYVLRPIKNDWTVRKYHKTCNKDINLEWCMKSYL